MHTRCEHCQKQLAKVVDTHSLLIVLQKVALSGYSWFQCALGGENAHYHNWQHWHCSHDAMLAGAAACINDHYTEEHLQPVDAQVRLHQYVLRANLLCKVCNKALQEQAYRFCLTQATPRHRTVQSHDDFEEWCCSLEHARQSASAVLATIKE